MAQININSHDLLGKLTIIKTCLSMIAENNNDPAQVAKYADIANKTNEDLIAVIKKLSEDAQNTNS